jgi:asparagine synthase (glutamine-hydrolysing)
MLDDNKGLKVIRKYTSLVKLGVIDPQLALLAWNLKRSQKTYLGYQHLLSLAEGFLTVRSRLQDDVHVAEFGVGRGGSATILGWLAERFGGTLSLYDVFSRIPAPTKTDGQRAQDRYRTILHEETEDYYGNIPDLLDTVKAELSSVCSLEKVTFIAGRYEETLDQPTEGRRFDLVHIDCDWYESVKAVLSYLKDSIRPGAIIQVDDYSNWQGCRIAVDETEWLAPFERWFVGGPLVIDTGNAGRQRQEIHRQPREPRGSQEDSPS